MALIGVLKGSRHTAQQITWTRTDGTAENLTGATVTGTLYNQTTGVSRAITGTLTLVTAASGIFLWTYSALDVGTAGDYAVQFTATFADTTTDISLIDSWVVMATGYTGSSYATVSQLRAYLNQTPGTVTDATLQDTLDRATAIITEYMSFAFSAYGILATNKDVRIPGPSKFLELPAYQSGTIAEVSLLYAKGSDGEGTQLLDSDDYSILEDGRLYRYVGWPTDWLRVKAIWGYGPAPLSVVQVCLEVAVNLWLTRDRGMSTLASGAEGGGSLVHQRALTLEQRDRLDAVMERVAGSGIA
jgi:hypothetical protein